MKTHLAIILIWPLWVLRLRYVLTLSRITRLVCIYVAGLLVVVGGVVVQSDETDRVWSEALFALTCCSSNQ